MDAEEYLYQPVVKEQNFLAAYRGDAYSNQSLQTEIPTNGKPSADRTNNSGILLISSGLLAISIVFTIALVAVLLKRLMFLKAFDEQSTTAKRDRQVPCTKCHFFNNNFYLKCAVHPSKVLTSEARDCSDYCPRR
ncbi:MAG: hypothetical protein IGR93_13590 [Hydrococcus sp. C42_A2020_068]|uniref:hypothetical protein n=1 Tax=Pleurocapsa sp. PCC 7327 TaxID=118163 RepID=UPI00029F84C4|nr:hypothetical protein [Pleurocapsa sp. PCC 7327]AFY79529.1 hypothetical protein Ple7327_4422 [Pleurocapsa sp. PCC 7327]MBF2021103.1 hypothetical protein [Hydrococcus sp. C42_A2020_068]